MVKLSDNLDFCQPNYILLGEMLDELPTAGNRLRVAIDNYLDVYLTTKRLSAEEAWLLAVRTHSENVTGFTIADQLRLLIECETNLFESKMVILKSINMLPDVVPISRLPTDILIHIFRQLVNMEYPVSPSLPTGQTRPKYPISLAHVCGRWRHIVHQSPSLWSRIRFTRDIHTNEQLIACIDFHTTRAEQVPMDIYITDLSLTEAFETPTLTSLNPLLVRVRSLEFQLNLPDASAVVSNREKACYLITKCLNENKGPLKRFVLNIVTPPKQRLLFMESISKHTNHNGPIIRLPYDLTEDGLNSITDLWLGGLYFSWGSRAYHGLTKLRLDICEPSSSSIPESQFINILVSSPGLQYLNVDLDIVEKTPSPPVTCLPDLEAIVGDVPLPKLIWPGTRELSLSIIGQPNRDSDALYDPKIQNFFSRANVTTFLGDVFLHDISELSHLLSIAPKIRILALTTITLSGELLEAGLNPSIEVLYLLGECEIEWLLLQQIVKIWNIKKLVFWRKNYIIYESSRLIDSEQALEEALSGLSTITVGSPGTANQSSSYLMTQCDRLVLSQEAHI